MKCVSSILAFDIYIYSYLGNPFEYFIRKIFFICNAATHLKMPEEEGEDEPDAHPHDPRHNHERQQTEVGKGLWEKNSLEYCQLVKI